MGIFSGAGVVTSGLVFNYDMQNKTKSWIGAPVTNSQWNGGSEVTPWTVGGTNTDVTNTSQAGPVVGAKTWRFDKSGTSNQWNGWESTYGSIWTGSSGDIWTTSYWYKTSAPAGLTGFGIGSFYTSDWTRAYNTTVLSNVSTIIADGEWHYNYTVVRFNEAYTNAIIADGPSWGYSTSAGTLYINGLQWNKNSYPTTFAQGTRSNTQALRDLTNNNTITATSLTYANDGTFSFNGSSDYLTIPNTTLGNGNVAWTISCWMKTTTTVNSLGLGSVISNISGGPVYSMMGVNGGKIVYWTYQNSAWAQKLGVGKTVNDGVWHMLTWVNYSNSTMDMYVDGILDSNVANSTSGNNNPVDVIGRSWAGYFPGSISSLTRYTRALTAEEVNRNFNAQRAIYGI